MAALYLLGVLTVWGASAGAVMLVSFPVGITAGWCSRQKGDPVPRWNLENRPGTLIILILGLVALGLVLRVYNLGRFGFRLDELYQFEAALGYLKTGEFARWDLVRHTLGNSYERAWLYTGQVALAFQWFGASLIVGRWVSLIWGLLMLIPLWVLGCQLGLSRLERLSMLFLVLVSPYFITASRWLRMYTMFTTAYLSFLVVAWLAVETNSTRRRILWGIPGLFLGAITFHLHPLFLVSFPGILLVGILWNREWIRDHAFMTAVLLGGFILLGMAGSMVGGVSEIFAREFALLSRPRWIYFLYPFQEYLGYSLGGLLFAALLLFVGHRPVEQYYLVIFVSSILILVFCTGRFPQYRYAGHLTALGYPLVLLAVRRLGSRWISSSETFQPHLLLILVLFIPVLQLPDRVDYIGSGNYGWVGFPGTNSPRYEDLVQYVNSRSQPGDFIGTFLIYDVYREAMRNEDIVVKNLMQETRSGRVVEEIRMLSSNHHRVWLLVPTHLRGSLSPEFSNLLEHQFEQPVDSHRFNVAVYRRSKPLETLASEAPSEGQ